MKTDKEYEAKRDATDDYGTLKETFQAAILQASEGKGKERHADDQPFDEQPIMWIEKYFKSYQLGQAVKKMHESQRMTPDAAIRELYGAMVYIAAHCISRGNE